jgi:SSS family solute:Na+ symporter
MKLIDWVALGIPLVLVLVIAKYTGKYLKSVADYMAGGRCAGRYMLCVARGEMTSGAAMFVLFFEIFSQAGFTYIWWGWMITPALMLMAITGFVVYRYRETRALTLAQFFEMRYSRAFRLFSGTLGFFAGIMNFGIIPAVGARFFVYFIGLPPELFLFGQTIPTFIPLMALFMLITVYLTLTGGQITVMLTDCASGLLDQWMFVIIVAALVGLFSWADISSVMLDRPAGQSMMNPFDSMQLKDFNLWFVVMGILINMYGTMAWQNASGYNSAARTPHESRMANILGRWREYSRILTLTVLAMCAVTFLNHAYYAELAVPVHELVASISNPQIQKQMLVPTALGTLLPAGIKGLLAAVVITGMFGGDTTHIHSWGSMFVQDIILPLRKKPLSPKQHIRYLRRTMAGVGVFAFLFGCLVTQTEYIAMWFSITMAIYIGGAGAVIIGGLYWKKGTTAAAWSAMLTGSTLSVGGIITRQIFPGFPLNGIQISFGSAITAIVVYFVVSLLTCRKDFNMDRLLHRGRYAVAEDQVEVHEEPKKKIHWLRIIGITDKFSLKDRWITFGVFGWSFFWVVVMITGTAWNLISPWSTQTWSRFWLWAAIILPIGIGVITTLWFTVGVLKDLRAFFTDIQNERTDDRDDGTVSHEK